MLTLDQLQSYDHIIVFFSGGKDSLATYLYLLEMGLKPEQIELWHHDIDGQGVNYMDWPITESYCKAIANHFGSPYFLSWKEGGFYREMNRVEQATAPIYFETPEGLKKAGGKSNRTGTRQKFPQVSPDLRVRWCSAYLKVDVARMALRNDERFKFSKTLVLSGERGEESAQRSRYNIFEPDSADGRSTRYERHIDRYRPIKDWSEQQVWDLIAKYKVNPHPAYKLGYGRVSCMFCIFGNKNQWATGRSVNPDGFERIAQDEQRFGVTIKRSQSVEELANNGTPYEAVTPEFVKQAMGTEFTEPVILDQWVLPAGAFGESCGPS